jgi:hypothetical protein
MECAELQALRREATKVFRDLTLRLRRAQEYAAANTCEASLGAALVRPSSDFEVYLQCRLGECTARLEAHIATHGCQA